MSMWELRSRPLPSVFFFLLCFSYIKLLTSILYKLKQVLSYFMHRTTFRRKSPLSACLSANWAWQEWWFWLAAVLTQCNFEQQTKGRDSDVCLLHMRSSHANAFYHSLVMMVAHDHKEEIPTNLYLSISTMTVPSWRRSFLSWHVENVFSEHYCQPEVFFCSWYYANFGAIAVIASTTYMTIAELFDEWSAPFSHEMMIAIDHDNNLYIEWHNINGNRRSTKACCWGK